MQIAFVTDIGVQHITMVTKWSFCPATENHIFCLVPKIIPNKAENQPD